MRVFCTVTAFAVAFFILLLLSEEQLRAPSAQKVESKMTSCFVEIIPFFNNKQQIAVNYSSHSDLLFSYSIFIVLYCRTFFWTKEQPSHLPFPASTAVYSRIYDR